MKEGSQGGGRVRRDERRGEGEMEKRWRGKRDEGRGLEREGGRAEGGRGGFVCVGGVSKRVRGAAAADTPRHISSGNFPTQSRVLLQARRARRHRRRRRTTPICSSLNKAASLSSPQPSSAASRRRPLPANFHIMHHCLNAAARKVVVATRRPGR